MNPKIEAVEPMDGACLRLRFENGEQRVFDVSPYLDKGIFRELAVPAYFQRVVASRYHVEWPNGQDFSHDTLYLRSVPADTLRAA